MHDPNTLLKERLYFLQDKAWIKVEDVNGLGGEMRAGHILEIRKSRENGAVYVRIYWLYHPVDDIVTRQDWTNHYGNEVIQSNHMAIVNADDLCAPVHVAHVGEGFGRSIGKAQELYWRRSYDRLGGRHTVSISFSDFNLFNSL